MQFTLKRLIVLLTAAALMTAATRGSPLAVGVALGSGALAVVCLWRADRIAVACEEEPSTRRFAYKAVGGMCYLACGLICGLIAVLTVLGGVAYQFRP